MTYVAKQPLYIGLARARNEGDVISEEDMKKYGWEDQCEKKEDKKDEKKA